MDRLRHWLIVRHRHNWILLFRFGVVGGSGVLVNLLTMVVCKKLGPDPEHLALDLPFTDYNVRWYHVFSTIAFVVANLWNFQLNRTWTFKSARHASWIREYWPFLVVGLLGQGIGLIVITLLMHQHSPIGLPSSVFDNTSGLRTKVYWAQLITVVVVTPVSFVLNKLWTFSAVRGRDGTALADDATAHELEEDLAEYPGDEALVARIRAERRQTRQARPSQTADSDEGSDAGRSA